MVIAIDGPAGVGKSTVAEYLAHKWNLTYLNTGKFYRAITFLALEDGVLKIEQPINPDSQSRLLQLASKIHWGFTSNAVLIENRILNSELHTKNVDQLVAEVSVMNELRHLFNEKFRGWGKDLRIVAEGRDLTSEVFPNAEVRIFLDASAQERARRRFNERSEGQSFEQILENIIYRDNIDRNKLIGALRLTTGCILIDTSDLTIQDVYAKVDTIVSKQQSN